MTNINSSPVSLPAGSYDAGDLQKSLDQAARGKAEKYDDAVRTAVHGDAEERDARQIPGYEFVEVENKDLGITERVQVFNPKLAEKAEADGAIPEAEAPTPAARTKAASGNQE